MERTDEGVCPYLRSLTPIPSPNVKTPPSLPQGEERLTGAN
ncbi:hypothetical protein HMPREF0973_00615 [Prevotella veroralis F0319]|uniref:Uncharacterized protein n=1 Tax=Prevotella veroralis F0319 TaxID=649761 RepID=C9MLY9_9BACT|nr:hypothetical protein HMPREF0973_00615 [Prevotella veroralis F0319]